MLEEKTNKTMREYLVGEYLVGEYLMAEYYWDSWSIWFK